MVQKEEEGDHPFGIEDLQYYVKRVEEKQNDLDFGVVKQYFPVDVVLSGALKICQDLYGMIKRRIFSLFYFSYAVIHVGHDDEFIFKKLACSMLNYVTCKAELILR